MTAPRKPPLTMIKLRPFHGQETPETPTDDSPNLVKCAATLASALLICSKHIATTQMFFADAEYPESSLHRAGKDLECQEI